MKPINPTEAQMQCAIVEWFRIRFKPEEGLIFAIPNGGSRGGKIIKGKYVPLEAINLKKQGQLSGIPDLCIPYLWTTFGSCVTGIYIELKRKGGKLSENQKDILALLHENGNIAVWSDNQDDVIRFIEELAKPRINIDSMICLDGDSKDFLKIKRVK